MKGKGLTRNKGRGQEQLFFAGFSTGEDMIYCWLRLGAVR